MAVPGQNAALAARINVMRSRGWALVDRRLAALLELARAENAMILVTGDHGMRPTWKNFHVNTVLRSAGLLAVDSAGQPDLARTQAISPAGSFIHVNRVERKGGIVPAERVEQVAQAAAAALLAARDPEGRPIVTRIWRPQPNDTLGIGGPAGGEVYFDMARGYYPSPALGDSVVTARSPRGAHGFPSIDPDMRSAFCAVGPGIGGRRLPTVRVIDAAPTVSAWLGIPPPADARGVSLLEAMRTPAP
jgi:arylsulfatase A-like enzyme